MGVPEGVAELLPGLLVGCKSGYGKDNSSFS